MNTFPRNVNDHGKRADQKKDFEAILVKINLHVVKSDFRKF